VIGYYGYGNLGDEAVLWAIRAHLRERIPHVSFCVLSGDPERTSRMHGVDAVRRGDARAVLRACREASWICSGGGSLFQDVTSWRSPVYYAWLHEIARLGCPRILVYAQGVGPLRRPLSRWAARRAFGGAAHITVRDAASAAEVRALGLRRSVEVVCDPALGLDPPPVLALGAPTVGVSVRPWPGEWLGALADALAELSAARGVRVRIVSFHAGRDLEVSRRLADRLRDVEVVAPETPEAALNAMSGLDLFVGMRLHALVLAAVAGVPVVGLAYDPKVEALAAWLRGMRVYPLPGDGGGSSALDLLGDWDARAARAAHLREDLALLRRLARRPAEIGAAWGAR
jgi:polysaccharide pyruvyl transferase CsaB